MNFELLHKPIYVRDHWRCRSGEGVGALKKHLNRKRMSEKRYGQELLQLEDKFNSLKRKLLQEVSEDCENCKKLKEEVDLWKSRALFGKTCLESLIEECRQRTELVVENLRELKEDNFDRNDILKKHDGDSYKRTAEGSKLSEYKYSKERRTGPTIDTVSGSDAERSRSQNKS